jgi:hypothetical protein
MQIAPFFQAACAGILAFSLVPAIAHAEIEATPSSDPNQLLLDAIRANGLGAAGLKPWHLRISFDVGKSFLQEPDKGEIEEWWIDSTHYKLSIKGTSFSQIEYETESGLRRAGVRNSAPPIFKHLREEIISPIPFPEDIVATLNIKRNDKDVGQAKFACLATEAGKTTPATIKVTPEIYCLDSQHPILRFESSPNGLNHLVFDRIGLFNGRYIAREVESSTSAGGQGASFVRLWTVKVEQLETLNDADAKSVEPPADTPVAAPIVTLSEKEARNLLIDHPKPPYPEIARAFRVWGDVVCSVKVGIDGHVISVSPTSGPLMLYGASQEGLLKWTFKPAKLNGDTAEFDTTITVPYRL